MTKEQKPWIRQAPLLGAYLLVSAIAYGTPALADEPRAVSPGTADQKAALATTCPTFSWTAATAAEGYEIVVYKADSDSPSDRSPVLEYEILGAASSWTPPLDACLDAGGNFAWAVRALERDGSRAYSAPLFFRTPAAPSVPELDRALEVIRAWERAHGDAGHEDRSTTDAPIRRRVPRHWTKGSNTPSAAISGVNPSAEGVAIGVRGATASGDTGSAALVGDATAESGDTAGLIASHHSLQGTAARLVAHNGGALVRGIGPAGEVLSVDAAGNLSATTLAGDGSGLSAVDAATLDGQLADSFAPAMHLHSGADVVAGTVAEPRLDAALARDVEVMPIVLATDGPGSGLDADTLDGMEASAFVTGGRACASGYFLVGIDLDGSLQCDAPPVETFAFVDEVGNVGLHSSMVIGRDGFPIISYYAATNNDLKVAHCTDARCSGSTTTILDSSGSVGRYTSIAIGTDGFPVISYRNDSLRSLKVAHCMDIACSSSSNRTLDFRDDVGAFTSIAIGTDGFPIISYYDSTNSDLKVAHCNDTLCSSHATTTLDGSGTVGRHTSIAIGGDGLPIISYRNDTWQSLKVAHCTDVACSSSTNHTLDFGENVGSNTSIAIGVDGLPIVSYFDLTNLDLKVAHCTDVSCASVTITTVDSADAVGEFSSISIGADGLPIIGYYDGGNGDLKVARCTDTICSDRSTRTLDGGGEVGGYISIAVGADARPIFSYWNVTNNNLKVAQCANDRCT